ncbi:MAG: methyltransferase domain-containing protein [Myxococcales bacterium]|nr:methyltransferase domain-containing protein [Myxococcales bacterium]
MTSNRWQDAWSTGDTPWDAGGAAPALEDLLREATDLPKGRVLVPGCGSGYDGLAWGRAGYEVTALDLVELAVERFRQLRDQSGVSAQQVDAICADFFTFEPPQPFDVIWDYTFLCALPPEMRAAWAEKMSRLVAKDGELITLIFPIRPDDGNGPPFAMSTELVSSLLSPYFTNVAMYAVPRSHPARQGREWLARWRLHTS